MTKLIFALLAFLISAACFAGETVIVGDSLTCGPFGSYLMQQVAKSGNLVTVYCTVSSAPVHWIQGKNPAGQTCQTMTSAKPQKISCGGNGQIPPFSKILADHKGAQFIVAMGTNSLGSPQVDASYKTMINLIKGNGSTCEWIGPPHLHPSQHKGFTQDRLESMDKNVNGFYTSLASATEGACPLIDSRDATAAGTPGNDTVDGVHRSDSAGKYWVQQISSSLAGSPTSSIPASSQNQSGTH